MAVISPTAICCAAAHVVAELRLVVLPAFRKQQASVGEQANARVAARAVNPQAEWAEDRPPADFSCSVVDRREEPGSAVSAVTSGKQQSKAPPFWRRRSEERTDGIVDRMLIRSVKTLLTGSNGTAFRAAALAPAKP